MPEIPEGLTSDEAVALMQEIQEGHGSGDTHMHFDRILLQLLRDCGYEAIASIYEKARDTMPFWYE